MTLNHLRSLLQQDSAAVAGGVLPLISPSSHYYSLHGILIELRANQPELFSWFDAHFGCFACREHFSTASFIYSLYCVNSAEFPNVDIATWTSCGNIDRVACYARGTELLFQDERDGICLIDLSAGSANGYINRACSATVRQRLMRTMFFPALFALLQKERLFRLHAAAVRWRERGIVICGPSGSGKTTLLLHLLQAGAESVADDSLFICSSSNTLSILGIPSDIGVSAKTAAFFPDIQSALETRCPDARGKFRVPLLNREDACAPAPIEADILLFPRVEPSAPTSLNPIARLQAALRCIPGNTFIGSKFYAQDNFLTLSRLVQSTRPYQVVLGRDMKLLAKHLRQVCEDDDET